VLEFDGGSFINHDLITVISKHGTTTTLQDDSYEAYLDELTSDLHGFDYNQKINSITSTLFNEVYKNYYTIPVNGSLPHISLQQATKNYIKYLLSWMGIRPTEIDEAQILHNVRIESHRWLVQRALRQQLYKSESGS
jgi:hypothetical protein